MLQQQYGTSLEFYSYGNTTMTSKYQKFLFEKKPVEQFIQWTHWSFFHTHVFVVFLHWLNELIVNSVLIWMDSICIALNSDKHIVVLFRSGFFPSIKMWNKCMFMCCESMNMKIWKCECEYEYTINESILQGWNSPQGAKIQYNT